ncbi:helix-turn-helix transcriptional regulator [Leptolyngbya sp. NK1-12]|uniref:Helix-turn-helix transcriptional regulator n=1 Tax=Leptolyngbya sp. NK1-12 TaxID=2547451 RepID=A0AA97AE59_9CYAN|nr:AraC family transcriptional regulator [Leptolyngbya sp. NK1-12]WNZ21645.1 helix-turn-helix transcriptional regulator [Leptolyngbya sp. NK1-12]
MSLKLSDSDWCELWQQEECNTAGATQAKTLDSIGLSEQVYRFSGPLGRGSERYIPLRNGLHLVMCDYELWEDMTVRSQYCYKTYPGNPCISFVVSGAGRTIHHGLTDYNFEVSGKNYLEFIPEGRETEDWSARDRIVKVRVGLQMEALQDLSRESSSNLPKELRLLVENQQLSPCYRLETTTPEMETVLQQILNCPYQGWMRRFYLESKALELLILWLAEAANRDCLPESCELSLSDIDRVHQAREFLMQHLENPPSLVQLARKVGLNDYKLKRGFRQLYGTTVFGYLHAQRMEKARMLLMSRQMKITEVAHAVGYASLPSFCLAFRKQFGVSPRRYTNS